MNPAMGRVNPKEDGMEVCDVIDEAESWETERWKPVSEWAMAGASFIRNHDHGKRAGLADSLDRLERWVEWIPMGWQRLYLELRCALVSVNTASVRSVWIHEPEVVDGGLLLDVDGGDRVVRGMVRKAWARSRCTCMRCGRPGKPRCISGYVKTLCARCAALETLSVELDRCLHDPWDGDPLSLTPTWPRELSPLVKVLMEEGSRLGAFGIESCTAGDPIPPATQGWLRDVWDHVQRQVEDVESRRIP